MRRNTLAVALLVLQAPLIVLAQGGPVGPEFRVNTYTPQRQFRPSVAVDPAGDFVVTWSSEGQDGSFEGVFGQRLSAAGVPLGGEFRVNTHTLDRQRYPSVAADSAGNFVVVWQSRSEDGSFEGVFGQRYSSTGAPLGGEFRVNTYTMFDQARPAVASDSAGAFVVAWQSQTQDGSDTGVYGQRFTRDGVPSGGEFRVNTFTLNDQAYPSVALDPGGAFFVVTWQSYQDGGFEGVFGQRYASDGTPLGGEFRVNTYTTREQRRPSVEVDSNGNFVVVWMSYKQDGYGWGVHGQRFTSAGAPIGSEFRVNSSTTSFEQLPSIASDAAGDFVVAWISDVGASWDVFGQRFAGSGAALGGEFRVNTFTTSAQLYPVAASDAAGHFVVVWESDTEDGSQQGIFAQRFNMIVPVELQGFGVE